MTRTSVAASAPQSCSMFSVPAAFAASAEVEELKAQVRMLQQRLDAMEQREKQRAPSRHRRGSSARRGDGHDGRRARRHG